MQNEARRGNRMANAEEKVRENIMKRLPDIG